MLRQRLLALFQRLLLASQQALLFTELLCQRLNLLIERNHLFRQQRFQLLLCRLRRITRLPGCLILFFMLRQRRIGLLLVLLQLL